MSARTLADQYRVSCIYPKTVHQSSASRWCGACRKGRKYSRPIVNCRIQNRHVATLTERLDLCFSCLEHTFKVHPERTRKVRLDYQRTANQRDYPLIFMHCYDNTFKHSVCHNPLVRKFFSEHEEGNKIHPATASAALSLITIYKNDPDLLDCYVWLCNNKKAIEECDDLKGLLPKFEGVGGVFPSGEERALVMHHAASMA